MTILPATAEQAAAIAALAHGEQMYGDKPYTWHLDRVAEVVLRHSGDLHDILPQALAGAYLHDVIEDVEDGEAYLGDVDPEVVRVVRALSKRHGQAAEDYYGGIRDTGRLAVAVKLADRIANITACLSTETPNAKKLAKYRHERDVFEAMRTPGELQGMWDELEQLYLGNLHG